MNVPDGFNPNTLKEYPELLNFYEKIGSTPILEISTPEGFSKIFAKCEWQNPTGTIKARVALAMIWRLLDSTNLPHNDITILEYSGGGLSIAIAELCKDLGLKCVLVLSESTPNSILKKLYAANAQVYFSKKELGFWGVMEKAKELKNKNEKWQFLYQHENRANLAFHENVTAKEILEQMDCKIDAWIASIGTGGTLAGVYRGLKAQHPDLKVYATTPKELPYGSEDPPNSLPKFAGSGGFGCGRKQTFILEIESEITEHFTYSYQEAKQEMARFYKATDLLIGSSAAANLLASYNLAEKLGPQCNILTIFPSMALDEEVNDIIKQ